MNAINENHTLHIVYPCYICSNEYASANLVIDHARVDHGYILKSRHIGYSISNQNKQDNVWQNEHFGCPSCWYHIPRINHVEHLMKHIMETHKPLRIEGFINPDREEDELMDSSEEESKESNVQCDSEEDYPKEQSAPKAITPKASNPKEDILEEAATEESTSDIEKEQDTVSHIIISRLNDISNLFKTLLD